MGIIETFLAEIDEPVIYADVCCVSGDVLKTIDPLNMQDRGRIYYSQNGQKMFFSLLGPNPVKSIETTGQLSSLNNMSVPGTEVR
jgi:hypothetical protein